LLSAGNIGFIATREVISFPPEYDAVVVSVSRYGLINFLTFLPTKLKNVLNSPGFWLLKRKFENAKSRTFAASSILKQS